MLVVLFMGALAGFAAPYAAPHVKAALVSMNLGEFEVQDTEMDLVTLLLLLLVAAIVTGGLSSPLLLAGALLGVFGKRIIAAVQGKTE